MVWSWKAVTEADEHPWAPACPAWSRALRSLDVSAGTKCPLEEPMCPSVTVQKQAEAFPNKGQPLYCLFIWKLKMLQRWIKLQGSRVKIEILLLNFPRPIPKVNINTLLINRLLWKQSSFASILLNFILIILVLHSNYILSRNKNKSWIVLGLWPLEKCWYWWSSPELFSTIKKIENVSSSYQSTKKLFRTGKIPTYKFFRLSLAGKLSSKSMASTRIF